MRSKRPFRSLIVCVSCAMVGCILASTAYSRRVNDLETERDIYASKSSNWERMAGERDETIDQLQTEVDKLTAELNAQTDLTLTYAGRSAAQPIVPRNTPTSVARGTASHPAAQRCSRA